MVDRSTPPGSLLDAREWLQAEVNEYEGLIARMAPALQESYREKSKPHNALAAFDALERAYGRACSNLACSSFRGKDTSLGKETARWQAALLAGWGGIEGWPDGD